MASWLPLFIFGAAMLVGLTAVSIYQTRAYRRYLAQHTAETQKVTAGQQEIIASQREANALIARQTAAVERIAAALERTSLPHDRA